MPVANVPDLSRIKSKIASMFKNYFKTTLRSLLRNKPFTFINIFGLAAGTFCCLYILLYVQEQYSYDRHEKDAAAIYRLGGLAPT